MGTNQRDLDLLLQLLAAAVVVVVVTGPMAGVTESEIEYSYK